MGKEYFEREENIFNKTVENNPQIKEDRKEELDNYKKAFNNYKKTVENLEKVKRGSWFIQLFTTRSAEKACEKTAKAYVEARKKLYKDIIIEDENAESIRGCLAKDKSADPIKNVTLKNFFEGLMNNSHNQHTAKGHLNLETDPLTSYKPKPSLWQEIKTLFTKKIPNFFKKIFGSVDDNSKFNKDGHEQKFNNATNIVEAQQEELNKEKAKEIKEEIAVNNKGQQNEGQNLGGNY